MRIYASTLLSIILRAIPHVPNFTPLGASCIWAARHRSFKFSIFYSIALLALTNAYLTKANGLLFWYPGAAFVYVGFMFYAVSGFLFKKYHFGIFGASLLGAVGFFLISNFGTFLTGMYGTGPAALSKTYVAGLPFFGYTLAADLLFSTLYHIADVLHSRIEKTQTAKEHGLCGDFQEACA